MVVTWRRVPRPGLRPLETRQACSGQPNNPSPITERCESQRWRDSVVRSQPLRSCYRQAAARRLTRSQHKRATPHFTSAIR